MVKKNWLWESTPGKPASHAGAFCALSYASAGGGGGTFVLGNLVYTHGNFFFPLTKILP